jgi:hypothetical protein
LKVQEGCPEGKDFDICRKNLIKTEAEGHNGLMRDILKEEPKMLAD